MSATDNAPVAGGDRLLAVLAACEPSFNRGLVGADAREVLDAACRRLPIDLSSFWGVESQLGTDRAEVDLLVEVKRGAPGHVLLAARQEPLLDALCEGSEPWAALCRFSKAWADPAHALHQSVRNIWLEFDLIAARETGADALAQPSVFWGPEPSSAGNGRSIVALLDAVGGEFSPFPKGIPREALEAAARQLPAGAQMFQVGAMRLRGDVVLRVCVNAIAPADAPGWLSSIGWSGDVQALQQGLETLAPLVRTIAVDVDFTSAGIGPKVGIECYLDWTNASGAQWDPLLDHVGGLGLCSAAKRRAIVAFPARTDFPLSEQLALQRDGFLHPVLYRNIHHVKLACVAGRFTEAKAYLGVSRPGVNVGQFFDTSATANEEDGWYSP